MSEAQSKFRYIVFPEHIYIFQYENITYEVKGSEVLNLVKDYLGLLGGTHSNSDSHQTK